MLWELERTNPEDHSRISTLLYSTFCDHLAFKSILLNENAVGKRDTVTMFFFPVNCLDGRSDKSTMDLMDVIKKEIESSDYVQQERPVNWPQTYDQMKASKKPFYTISIYLSLYIYIIKREIENFIYNVKNAKILQIFTPN